MPRVASYPDWVQKHIQKGQYVNKVNGNYYLYSAHSERREGISHPVRVCDGYIGRITQEDGLIPSKKRGDSTPTVSSHPKRCSKPAVWVFGLCLAVIKCSETILLGLTRNYTENAALIYVMSILELLYGKSNQSLYEMSVLSFAFPNLTIPDPCSNPVIQTGLERGQRMISDAINKTYRDDWPLLRAYLSASVVIKNNRGYKVTDVYGYAPDLFRKYNLQLDDEAFESLIQKAR